MKKIINYKYKILWYLTILNDITEKIVHKNNGRYRIIGDFLSVMIDNIR